MLPRSNKLITGEDAAARIGSSGDVLVNWFGNDEQSGTIQDTGVLLQKLQGSPR